MYLLIRMGSVGTGPMHTLMICGASPGAGFWPHCFRGGSIRLIVPLANTLLNVR